MCQLECWYYGHLERQVKGQKPCQIDGKTSVGIHGRTPVRTHANKDVRTHFRTFPSRAMASMRMLDSVCQDSLPMCPAFLHVACQGLDHSGCLRLFAKDFATTARRNQMGEGGYGRALQTRWVKWPEAACRYSYLILLLLGNDGHPNRHCCQKLNCD